MEKVRQVEKQVRRIETTIGDLIEAITDIALKAGKTESEGYKLASATLEHVLRRSKSKKEQNTLHP